MFGHVYAIQLKVCWNQQYAGIFHTRSGRLVKILVGSSVFTQPKYGAHSVYVYAAKVQSTRHLHAH